MSGPAQSWSVSLSHGHSPGVQLRAALCVLALQKHRRVFMQESAAAGSFLQLLSLEEARRYFHALQSSQKQEVVAGRAVINSGGQPLHLSLTDVAHVHAGIAGKRWLGLLDATDGAQSLEHAAVAPQKMWQFGTGSRATLMHGPEAEGLWPLPWPVHPVFATPGAILGDNLLWLAGALPWQLVLPQILAAVKATGQSVTLFDAFGLWNLQALPRDARRHITICGPVAAEARRALFCGCKNYCMGDAHAQPFAVEAAALGLALQQTSDKTAAALGADNIVDVEQLMERVLSVMEGTTAAAAVSRTLHGQDSKTVTIGTVVPIKKPELSALAVMLLGAIGPQDGTSGLAKSIAALDADVVFAQVGPHTLFLPQLMLAHLTRAKSQAVQYVHKESEAELLNAAFLWLSRARAHAALMIIAPAGDAATTATALQKAQAWLHDQSSGQQNLPVIAINAAVDFLASGVSKLSVGAQVASSDISWGVYAASNNRFVAKYFRNANTQYDINSQFMHPLTRPMHNRAEVCDARLWSSTTLRLALQHDRVDAIFMAGGPMGSAVQTMRSMYATKPVPWVAVLHGLHAPHFQYDMAAFILNGPIYPFDGFISPSHGGREAFLFMWRNLQEWLAKQGHKQALREAHIDVIPYGIDTHFYSKRHPLACRQNMRLPPGGVGILAFGRISRRFKTCLLPLLLAMQALQHEGHLAYLVIGGALMAASELSRLQKAVSDLGLDGSVHFRVDVSLEDKAQLLSAADIFVAMSDSCQETHGIAPIEAMAAGLPVVAAAWNGFREIVQHDETGFLIPTAWTDIDEELFVDNIVDKQSRDLGFDDLHETVVTDVAALAHRLKLLIDSPSLRAKMGESGVRRAKEHFEARTQGEKIAACLLDKIAIARAHDKQFVRPQRYMLVDRVDQRFAHYASGTQVDQNTWVVPGPKSHDPAQLRSISQYIGAIDDEEAEIMVSIAAAAHKANGPVQMAALLGPRVDRLRLMRCLKYDILRVTQAPDDVAT